VQVGDEDEVAVAVVELGKPRGILVGVGALKVVGAPPTLPAKAERDIEANVAAFAILTTKKFLCEFGALGRIHSKLSAS
jgi:hypothetical protein